LQVSKRNIRIRGKEIPVDSITIDLDVVIATGTFVKIASFQDEGYEQRHIGDPARYIDRLKKGNLKADIFTFIQNNPDNRPMCNCLMELDNIAAIKITSFNDWWTKKLPQESRKNVKKAEKKGVIVKSVNFDDDLVNGIRNIFNETPSRQGRPFWHYGKDFETVKWEMSDNLDKAEFIGAYHNGELIGFIKILYRGKYSDIVQILSMVKHQDKRPTNALLSKAVEISELRQKEYLVYGKYIYGNKASSSLIDFKIRNGFEMLEIRRYFVPMTLKGKIMLKLKLHHGFRELIPEKLMYFLIDLRAKWHKKK